MNKKLSILYILLIGSLSAQGRPRRVSNNHGYSTQRALPPVTTFQSEESEAPEEINESKFLVIKPRNIQANEGRFLNHILLLRAFMQPTSNQPAYPNMLPYLIINNPTNLTNINNNTLNNVAPTAAPVTAGTAAGARITLIRDNQALAYGLPLNPQVYQQRQQDSVPQILYAFPLQDTNMQQRKANRNPNRKTFNRFREFAGNLRNVEFL